MSSDIPLLSNLNVAAPCSASWQDMEAVDGDRVHFCGGCKKNVYNLSAMSQGQAEGLLRKHEGHLCVRYYKRTDGTILTQNCPVGQAALRLKMIARSKQAALAAAALASMVGLGYSRLASPGDALVGRHVPVTGSSAVPVPVAQPDAHERDNDREVMGSIMTEVVPQQKEFIGKVRIEPARMSRKVAHYNVDLIKAEAKSLGIHVPEH